jgi:hypothetical protein
MNITRISILCVGESARRMNSRATVTKSAYADYEG